MTNKQLQKTMNEVGLSQSDLARLIFDTDKLQQYQRIKVNRYLSGKTKVPHWLPVILKMYIQAKNEH
jgi:hypothetical protein